MHLALLLKDIYSPLSLQWKFSWDLCFCPCLGLIFQPSWILCAAVFLQLCSHAPLKAAVHGDCPCPGLTLTTSCWTSQPFSDSAVERPVKVMCNDSCLKIKCSDFPPSFLTLNVSPLLVLFIITLFFAACLYCSHLLHWASYVPLFLCCHCGWVKPASKWEMLGEIWCLLCLRQLVLFLGCVSREAERLEEMQDSACLSFLHLPGEGT